MYQDLSTCHNWPFEKGIVDLPIKTKGNLKRTSGNSLSPLGASTKISAMLRRPYSLLHRRFQWGGALRDDTKNGCVGSVADYRPYYRPRLNYVCEAGYRVVRFRC